MKICLDPGHDGVVDPGAIGPSGIRESDIAMQLAVMLKNVLEQDGHEVILTRSGPDQDSYELYTRTDIANSSGANIFVSLHCNASVNSRAHGVETWYADQSLAGKALAEAVQEEMVYGLGLADRGVKSTAQSRLYVLLYTDMPSILIEVAFISNPAEEVLLSNPDWLRQAASAIGAGIARFAWR